MSTTNAPKTMSRREFLKFASIAGVTVVGGYFLSEQSSWLDKEGGAAPASLQPAKESTRQTQMRELVRYATMAANGHNAQAWKFAVNENRIEIHPDYSRRLPVVDAHDRELWISLGCALENLLVAARATGFDAEVTYPDSADFVRIDLTGDSPQADPLFGAIALRQTTRSAFDGRAIRTADLDVVQALTLEPGISLRWLTSPTDMEKALEYVNQGNLSQYADKAFLDELVHWLRFNKKEALQSRDGLYTRASGNLEVPRWIGEKFVLGTKPRQQADADAEKWRSSASGLVVASATEDKTAWVRTGQVYERLALKTTALNIKTAFLNQPIEVTDIRRQFQSALGMGQSNPQLLLRFGYADAMPRSYRRPVDAVIVSQ